MIYALIFSFLVFRTYSDCSPIVSDPAECAALPPNTGYSCCLVVEGACVPAQHPDCPTTTTAAPTTTTTSIATTTTSEATTTCYCPTSVVPVGGVVGDCDCDGGVIELRYIYQDTVAGVNIRVFYDQSRTEVLCNFGNVQPNEEIICEIAGNTVTPSGYSKFAKETPFTITYPSGETCEAQYHTSCSRDIIGTVQPECDKLVVSGWRGLNNGDCDDGKEPCSCSSSQFTTTWNPEIYSTRIGDHCYCDSGCTPAPVVYTKSKSSKKSKGSKGKGKASNSGSGCGECDCDKSIGMQMLRVRYSNAAEVDIFFYDQKGQNIIYSEYGVDQGKEVTCSVTGTVWPKLAKNTMVKWINPATNENCVTEFHTSCSRDIVGTIGSEDCGLVVTAWADDSECADVYQECPCDGVLLYDGVDPYEEPEKEVETEVCFCSNRQDGIASLSQLQTTRRRLGKSNDVGLGVGSCECDKSTGMQVLRFVYNGAVTANSITVYYNKNMLSNEVMCSYVAVAPGDEMECRIADYTDASGAQIYGDFATNTFLVIETDSDSCVGSIHTSCSRDIVGYAAENCDSVVVTGWADGDGDCDDGFDPCDCDTEYENAFRIISAADTLLPHVYVHVVLVLVAVLCR